MIFYAATILIIAGVALYVSAPLTSGLVRHREKKDADEIAVETWEHERALAVQGLRELEFDRQMGKLTDADYESLHAALETKALEAMSALEKFEDNIRRQRLAALDAPPKTKPPAPAPETAAEAKAPAPKPPSRPAPPARSTAPPPPPPPPVAKPAAPPPEPRWSAAGSGADHRMGGRRVRFCPQCGQRVLVTANFCGECGASLRAGERSSTRAS